MDGVSFKQVDQYALCCVDTLSAELQQVLRDNLTRICHGVDQACNEVSDYNLRSGIVV